MDRAPSFYPTSEVLRMHPDWPLLRPRTPQEQSESEWTAYSRTSSRSSSYHDMSNDAPPDRPNWPFPTRTSSLACHPAGDGYAGSIHEVPWRSPPNLTSAFDSDSEDEDDKPRRLVRRLRKKSSSPKSGVDRPIFMRSVDEESRSLSQGQHGRKDSAAHGSRKVSIPTAVPDSCMSPHILMPEQWSILLPRMSKSNPKSEKKPKSDKNSGARKSTPRFLYIDHVPRPV
ncbi:hypothetical protein FGG08_002589 [Glutinoglossum americanum]|uniref:Uncharacterized protein n=1 Tax=Glutinoglossum americanum TaxID=1670608 RepID=A0A9P8I611_9PEZI|nr:hypothetical protein FGG08_002589 [Glutinoglossum americanum]